MPGLTTIGLGKYLPCSILSRKPLVLAAYERDFLDHLDAYELALPADQPVTLIVQLGWQCQTDAGAMKLAQDFHQAQKRLPQLSRIVILANEPEEAKVLTAQGMETVFCNQNAFLDEKRCRILPFVRKRFDAIYIARITPFKRHQLLNEVKNLHLIGNYSEKENAYAQEILQTLSQAKWTRKYLSRLIMFPINQARCGICVSAEEGAMFVSAEYLLCGLPLVNTDNIGGRDVVMPDFAVKQVADEPASIANAVQQWVAKSPAPAAIREATLAKMRPHREKLLNILQDIGVSDNICERYARRFPHKLGLRCGRTPWENLTYGLPYK